MKRKYIPYVIGIPNLSVGLLWAMNMSLIPMLVGTVTKSNMLLGVLTSMGAFTGIFVQYLAGIVSDRSNFSTGRRKPFVLAGALSAALFVIILPFSRTYAVMLLIAFLFYFSLNFFQGPYYTLIPEVVENSKLGFANGFSKIISVLGSGVILLTGPMLWEVDHKLPFLAAAFLGIVSVLSGTLPIKEDTTKFTKASKITFDFVKYPSVLKLFAACFFIFLSYGCITPYFVKYCVEYLGLSNGTASTGLFLLTIVGALFAVPAGILSDRTNRSTVLFAGTLIFGIGLAAAAFAKSMLTIYLILSMIGIGFICIQVTIYAILAEIVPKERLGEFMGIINMFISLSQWMANLSMGALLDSIGFKYMFPISALIMLIASAVVSISKFEKIEEYYELNVEESNG